MAQQQCRICIEALDDAETMFKAACNHTFHNECLQGWIDTKFCGRVDEATCPLCVQPTLQAFVRAPGSTSLEDLRARREDEEKEERRLQVEEDRVAAARVLVDDVIAEVEQNYAVRGLFEAVRTDDAQAVTFYLDAGADVNARNTRNVTPIVLNGQLALRIETAQNALTPIMLSAVVGAANAAQILLSRGADPRMQDAHGLDAFAIARRTRAHGVLSVLNVFEASLAGTAEDPIVL